MGETRFTDDQRKVINARDENVLVSAAAGSGKTTVLVERIIRKIMGQKLSSDAGPIKEEGRAPVDIDKILVLTFTNAAAASMRNKIVKAINDEISKSETPDSNLVNQSVLIHNAQITTIHSFCLFLLRNHFAEVGIDPAFKVAGDGEVKLIEGNVVDELIDDLFENGTVADFELLADRVTTKNSLDGLKSVILDSYRESRNAPYLQEYFEDRRRDYECKSIEDMDSTPWISFMIGQMDEYLDECIDRMKDNIRECNGLEGMEGYLKTFESDLINLQGLRDCKGYVAKYDYLQDNPTLFVRIGRLGAAADADIAKRLKENRDRVKEIVNDKFIKKYYYMSPQDTFESLAQNNRIVNALIDVLVLYDERLKAEKNKRKIIDFGDMEHYALSILVKRENRENKPTRVAIDYASHYDEIMVDEYQDSNRIQEEILEAISAKINSRFNRFMVGDVKQSIYSFRQACPDIFIAKYDTYATGQEGCERIDLSKNFRSRDEVLASVNSIFERTMDRDLGMVSYDDSSKLYLGADYPDTAGDKITELLILKENDDSGLSKVEQEASLVANKILELKNSGFEVKDDNGVRKCDFRDIVILLRSSKGTDEVYKKVLEKYDIPTFISSKTGYFSSLEVREMMSLLQVLDNPRQDIPLFGTLRGAFGGFSEEEIATIKISAKGELIDVLREIAAIDAGSDFGADYPMMSVELIEKVTEFLAFIDKWRKRKLYTLIHILISEIIEEKGYMYHIGSLPFGEQRMANVYMLIEKAKQYEAGSFKGLYHFVRYIEEIRSYEVDFGEAVTLDEKSNVVRIMTIHASKGLEFPICFVSGMGKMYNTPFTKEDIIYDNSLGIGLERVDLKLNIKQKDLRRSVIADSLAKNMAAEEMRILYVAMTRAKEKLILTGATKDADKLLEAYEKPNGENKVLPYSVRCDTNSFLKLIVAAVGQDHEDVIKISVIDWADILESDTKTGITKAQRRLELMDNINSKQSSSEEAVKVEERIRYQYPYKNLEGLYTKTSVSELKIAAIEEKLINHDLEGIPAEFFTEHENSAYIPAFAAKEEQVKGTTRGTAYHRVMELFDFAGNVNFASLDEDQRRRVIEDEIQRMINSEKIKAEDAELVDKRKIAGFVASDLGQRMCRAADRGDLHLEEPFVLQIEASRLGSDYPDSEKVLIQGIIDAFFEEDGRTVLMDYKTDRISDENDLVERYRLQLEYYKEAIEKICKTKVGEVLIYSFALEKTIVI